MRLAYAALVGYLVLVYVELSLLLPIVGTLRVALLLALFALVAASLSGARLPNVPQTWLLAALTMWVMVSAVFAVPAVSAESEAGRGDWFWYLVKNAFLYATVALVLQRPGTVLRFAHANLALGGLVALTTIVTHRAGMSPLHGYDEIWRMVNFYGGIGDGSNEFALVMVMLLPLPALLVRHESSRARKIVLSVLGLAFLMCITRSRSRGGFLALLVVVPQLVWALRLSLAGNRQRVLPVIAGLAIVAFVFMNTHPRYWQRVGGLLIGNVSDSGASEFQEDSSGAMRRLDQYGFALELMARHPIAGVGPGAWYDAKVGLLGLSPFESNTRLVTHNGYLHLGAETGVVGLALFLATIIFTFRSLSIARRRFRQQPDKFVFVDLSEGLWIGLSGYCVCLMFLSEHLNQLLYMWTAMAVTLEQRSKATERDPVAAREDRIVEGMLAAGLLPPKPVGRSTS